MSMLTLYHFTNREAWTDIVYDGEIRPSGRSLDREGGGIWPAHNSPDIVWMTTNPTPGWCCERSLHGVERYAVRFTLRLPAEEVADLWTWATRHKVLPDGATWRPSRAESENFRCVERPVMAHTEWVAIDDMHRDGLCPGAEYDTPAFRARYAESVASRPVMTPMEIAEGLAFVVSLRDALRLTTPGEPGARSPQSKEAR